MISDKNPLDLPRLDGSVLRSNVRVRFEVRGTVQGVGFRPFVFRIARKNGLSGWVRNDPSGVTIQVEGRRESIAAFSSELEGSPPPLARVDHVFSFEMEPSGGSGFAILESGEDREMSAIAPADSAVCSDCLAEMRDPSDRRHRYPFINCTNCGPRFTIIRGLPYDRPLTSMASFEMCPECRREYENPADRRFHAQPVACPDCGPRAWLAGGDGKAIEAQDPVRVAADLLAEGKIVAVKGLGGFHLACDASNAEAVARLRIRKRREEKPFAVMAASIGRVREFAWTTGEEEALLASPRSPIVLLRKRAGCSIAPAVAPRNKFFGTMLPYTPLHHLLLEGPYPALVMTSGNLTDEPIAFENSEAVSRLEGIADYFLLHDRPIVSRADDSIVRIVEGRATLLRRSRGWVPDPVFLPFEGPPVLALGADLKNAVCVTRGDCAFPGPHIGDLSNPEALEAFEASIAHLIKLLGVKPAAVAHDMHPGYFSAKYARSLNNIRKIAVQHHHAHIASVMAENGLEGRVIGVAFDGTGFGTDGTVWGGEFLVCEYGRFDRAGRLGRVPLPGAEAAVREGWRTAVSHLHHALGPSRRGEIARFLPSVPRQNIDAAVAMIERRFNSPLTSSMGRLFDAAAAIAGVSSKSTFEGQAAMEFEGEAESGRGEPYPFAIEERDGCLAVDPGPAILALGEEACSGAAPPVLSMNFHRTVEEMVNKVCAIIAQRSGLDRVALSGGCFQNADLLVRCILSLSSAGFKVYTHSQVPPNDGAIALGQAAVAACRILGAGDK